MDARKVVHLPYGRDLSIGSRWQSNDPRRLSVIEIVDVDLRKRCAYCRNVVNSNLTTISFDAFTIGKRGWSRV